MSTDATTLNIKDIPSGTAYLADLAMADPETAEHQLMRFLDALIAAPPAPDVLFALLEQTRLPLCFVEEEMARRYHNKPLLLEGEEERCFRQVVAAWRKMAEAYALCDRLNQAQSPAPSANPEQAAPSASVLHRCLYYVGLLIVEHYRARRELPPGVWLELHGHFARAEARGVAYTPVQDALENSLQATHCAAAYATPLLIDIASPYSSSVRNLNLIRRWAGMWAPLVAIHRLESDIHVPPYAVSLTRDAPLHPSAASEQLGDDVRILDTTRLGLQINHMLSQLRLHITPSQLGLGEELSGHVTPLLEHLLRPWTQSASPRRFRRFDSVGVARVAVGFEAMHYCVTGQEFAQPDASRIYSRGEFDQLFTFREAAEPDQRPAIKPHINYPVDEWVVINHSANGFRLARTNAGQKIMHGQLLVVCPHDGERFLLAQVNWLMQEQSGGLVAGVSTLPGLPAGIGARHVQSSGGVAERYARAFLLPALPAIKEEASLVLPAGMYQASRVLEVFSGKDSSLLRMLHVLQRGTDFDRISFQPA